MVAPMVPTKASGSLSAAESAVCPALEIPQGSKIMPGDGGRARDDAAFRYVTAAVITDSGDFSRSQYHQLRRYTDGHDRPLISRSIAILRACVGLSITGASSISCFAVIKNERDLYAMRNILYREAKRSLSLPLPLPPFTVHRPVNPPVPFLLIYAREPVAK